MDLLEGAIARRTTSPQAAPALCVMQYWSSCICCTFFCICLKFPVLQCLVAPDAQPLALLAKSSVVSRDDAYKEFEL